MSTRSLLYGSPMSSLTFHSEIFNYYTIELHLFRYILIVCSPAPSSLSLHSGPPHFTALRLSLSPPPIYCSLPRFLFSLLLLHISPFSATSAFLPYTCFSLPALPHQLRGLVFTSLHLPFPSLRLSHLSPFPLYLIHHASSPFSLFHIPLHPPFSLSFSLPHMFLCLGYM